MIRWLAVFSLLLTSCASEPQDDSYRDYVERTPTTILEAPGMADESDAQGDSAAIERGKYLVELLGCGACHTSGALVGEPDLGAALAGSDIGIAFTTPLQNRYPGVVYAANITPDMDTGIGRWSLDQIVAAIRRGAGKHGRNLAPVMPWPGYARVSDDDAYSIARYLQQIEPVRHKVPATVQPGDRATGRFVYFGVYEKR